MEKEGLQGEHGPPVRVDALGASTTLASNKSLLRIEHVGERGQRRILRLSDPRERHEKAQDNPLAMVTRGHAARRECWGAPETGTSPQGWAQ